MNRTVTYDSDNNRVLVVKKGEIDKGKMGKTNFDNRISLDKAAMLYDLEKAKMDKNVKEDYKKKVKQEINKWKSEIKTVDAEIKDINELIARYETIKDKFPNNDAENVV